MANATVRCSYLDINKLDLSKVKVNIYQLGKTLLPLFVQAVKIW